VARWSRLVLGSLRGVGVCDCRRGEVASICDRWSYMLLKLTKELSEL
jgi:hypothetical protein